MARRRARARIGGLERRNPRAAHRLQAPLPVALLQHAGHAADGIAGTQRMGGGKLRRRVGHHVRILARRAVVEQQPVARIGRRGLRCRRAGQGHLRRRERAPQAQRQRAVARQFMGFADRQRLRQPDQHAGTGTQVGIAGRQRQRCRCDRDAAGADRWRFGQGQLRLSEFFLDPSGQAHEVARARHGPRCIDEQPFGNARPLLALGVSLLHEEAAQAALAAEIRGDHRFDLHHAAGPCAAVLDLGNGRRRRAAWLHGAERLRRTGQAEKNSEGRDARVSGQRSQAGRHGSSGNEVARIHDASRAV
ncbi:hypothetical protein D9M72_383610 [compost metagenome]